MTRIQEHDLYKHEAKQACKENGIKAAMVNMELLESGINKNGYVDYVMFEDRKTGKQYQCYANWSFYTIDHPSKWIVEEYVQ